MNIKYKARYSANPGLDTYVLWIDLSDTQLIKPLINYLKDEYPPLYAIKETSSINGKTNITVKFTVAKKHLRVECEEFNNKGIYGHVFTIVAPATSGNDDSNELISFVQFYDSNSDKVDKKQPTINILIDYTNGLRGIILPDLSVHYKEVQPWFELF